MEEVPLSKEKEKRKKKAEKKPSAVLRLRKHTLEGIMRDFERISKPLKPLKPLKRKKRKKEEE